MFAEHTAVSVPVKHISLYFEAPSQMLQPSVASLRAGTEMSGGRLHWVSDHISSARSPGVTGKHAGWRRQQHGVAVQPLAGLGLQQVWENSPKGVQAVPAAQLVHAAHFPGQLHTAVEEALQHSNPPHS